VKKHKNSKNGLAGKLLPVLAGVLAFILIAAVPVAAQYNIYDLGVRVTTQDIQTDNTNAVHLLWTDGGTMYYGRIVNNAISGTPVQVATGVNTIFWRPYLSVRPDGSEVHTVWIQGGGGGNSLMHSWRNSAGVWTTETVWTAPSTQVLFMPSCAIDSSGIVHVLFVIWNNVASNEWSTIFYQRKLANGQWEGRQQFTPLQPEYKFPMLFVDPSGGVHATWNIIGSTGGDSFEVYYRYAPSGGTLMNGTTYKTPKASDVDANTYGDLYVDHNGVVHRAIGSYSNSKSKLAIDYSQKAPGGSFSAITRPSIDFLWDLSWSSDAVPTVVANEDGRVVVAWGEVRSGANLVRASLYDPRTHAWSVSTVDPAAGIPDSPNSYRVAMTSNHTNIYGVWRGGNGNMKLFIMPIGSALAVTSPNGGERWRAGSTQNITWQQNGLSGDVTIDLYKNGTKSATIATPTASSGTYAWVIPSGQTLGSDYKIRVFQASVSDSSDADFSIISATTPEIALSRSALIYKSLISGPKTPAQQIYINNIGGGSLTWTASASRSWISVNPGNGTGNGLLTIGVNPAGLSAGSYSGTVTVSDPNALVQNAVITVSLNVSSSGSSPFGVFDIPATGSTVRGSIAISGWALDDIGTAKVEVRRNPVAGDPAEAIGADGLIYIGDAVFVDGARPDIETAFPGYPMNSRGGWGYLMLTYGLPDKGNGTVTLHAVAWDVDGHRADLGEKTITANNRNHTKPFGTIDTPGQGGTAYGSGYINFGWALTPPPASIPTDGSTIGIWVDGVFLGRPVYNQYRADIASSFPGYANKDGAVGYYYFNTTGYTNGPHQIGWSVKDSAGAEDGIGSRFFTIFNGAAGGPSSSGEVVRLASATPSGAGGEARPYRRLSELAGMRIGAQTPVYSRTGFVRDRILAPAYPDSVGKFDFAVDCAGRIEVHLDGLWTVSRNDGKRPAVSGPGAARYEGYLIVGQELRPLPIGSTMDASTGVFYWQPGPGFNGRYEFVFVRKEAGLTPEKRLVNIRVSSGN
jgi:hypothetical protein